MVLAHRLGVGNQGVHLSSQELGQESKDVALEKAIQGSAVVHLSICLFTIIIMRIY